MKKGLLILFIMFLMVGCGIKKENKGNNNTNKTTESRILICEKSVESTVNFKTKMSYYFTDNTIEKVDIKYEYDLSGYTEDQRKQFANNKICETDSIKEELDMKNCTEGLNGTLYVVSGTSTKIVSSTSKYSIDQGKKELEEDGWTCEKAGL